MASTLVVPRRKILLLGRHGESEANVQGIRQGKEGNLTPRGVAQARAMGAYLKDAAIQVNCSSTDERAYLSALEVEHYTGLAVQVDDLYIERRPPSMAVGVSSKDPEMNRRVKAANIIGELTGKAHLDEEHFNAMRIRAATILQKALAHSADCISIMMHYRTILSVVCHVERQGHVVPEDYHHAEEIALYANGSITRLIYEQRRKGDDWLWKRDYVNDTSHLRSIN